MSSKTTTRRNPIIEKISYLGYEKLFQYLDETPLLDIWSNGENQQILESIVLDQTIDSDTRFNAAEILFYKTKTFPNAKHKSYLAQLYAEMLGRDDELLSGNVWALPGEIDGEVGKHLLQLGQEAIPYISPLLENSNRIYFEGSEEATIDDEYQYRINDLAAYFISKIRGVVYANEVRVEDRDKEIEMIKGQLLSL